jgi:hypothetical protein
MNTGTRKKTKTTTTTKPTYWDVLVEYLGEADHQSEYPRTFEGLVNDVLVYARHAYPELTWVCDRCSAIVMGTDRMRHVVLTHGHDL